MEPDIVEGPCLKPGDAAWLNVIDTFTDTYQQLRSEGIPEDAAIRLVLSQLIDSIRNTYRI